MRSGPLRSAKNTTINVMRLPSMSRLQILVLVLVLCQSFAVSMPRNSTDVPGNSDISVGREETASRCAFVTQQENNRERARPVVGAYVPQCSPDGNFLPQQCWASSGYCWCVSVLTGAEIPGTRTPPGSIPVDCTSSSEGYKENDFCPPGWHRFGTRCYIFISTIKTWIEAETYCLFEGATLTSVHSEEELRFLQTLTRGNTHEFPRTWIGGTDAIQNGLWLWSDGSRFDFKKWLHGLTMSSSEQCLEMNVGVSLEWNDLACNNKKPFVCAKNIQSPPTMLET